jgi:hypothetical protein
MELALSMRTNIDIADRFNNLDVHDDTVEGLVFRPALNRRSLASVEISLFRKWHNLRRSLSFSGCANFEVILDADVLLDNAPSNAAYLEASANASEIELLLKRHKKSWNVEYEKAIDPSTSKSLRARKLVLFRVRLFGGNLLVLARSFTIKRVPADSFSSSTKSV